MKEITVTLETVTPLFLGGANPRGAPELRAPSFRGALRYWLRAALGGALGDNAETVRQEEAVVFGSTDEKTGSASAITVRLAADAPMPQQYTRQPSVVVEKGGKRFKQPVGRDYLYWSMAESGKLEKGNYQPPKQFYPAGIPFNVTLSSRSRAYNADQSFGQAMAALWLLVHLGGIGSRSRRTGGSLSVKGKYEIEGLKFQLETDALTEIVKQLSAGLRKVRERFSYIGTSTVSQPFPAFDILYPKACRVWVLDVWSNSERAVNAIGEAMRDFRTYREPDHTNVARWLAGENIYTVERAVFGLPLPYRYSDGGPSGVVQGRIRKPAIDRRASPLWLKVSKTVNGRYVGVATLFKSAFLPTGEKLHAKTKGTPPPINAPEDYMLIEQWIAEKFPKSQEVRYA